MGRDSRRDKTPRELHAKRVRESNEQRLNPYGRFCQRYPRIGRCLIELHVIYYTFKTLRYVVPTIGYYMRQERKWFREVIINGD